MTPGEFLEQLKIAELKQSEFARIIDKNPRQVRRWASGESAIPHAEAILLCQIAGVQLIKNKGKKCRN